MRVPAVESQACALEAQLERSCPLCFGPGPEVLLADATRRLMRCPGCGVAYVHPWPSETEIAAFFRDTYIATQEDVDVRFGTRQEGSHRGVAHFIQQRKTRGRILDIGCAGGHFLEWFFPATAWEKWGVEVSPRAAAAAREKGIQVCQGDIHSSALPDGFFDVVTLLDTFYYLSQPRRELAEMRRILKPDGLLVLVLLEAGSHIWRYTGWRSKLLGGTNTAILDTQHLFFYDPRSVTFLLRECGFCVRDLCPWPTTRQVNLLRDTLFRAYFSFSALVWRFSAFRFMLGPKFLVAGAPGPVRAGKT
jgi:SAM-dependent methyltransferase